MGYFPSQETKPTADGDKGNLSYSCSSLISFISFFSSFHDTPCFFVGLRYLLVLNYHLTEIVACPTSALVLSFTQTGGEEKSAGQTDPSPRSGQASKNEEEKGLPGKVRGHTGSRFTTSPSSVSLLCFLSYCL